MGRPINDITTTLDASPLLKGEGYPEKFKARQKELYPDLKPLRSQVTLSQLFALAEQTALTQTGWTVGVCAEPRLEAVATTRLLRFKDDVVIEVRGESGGGSSLHVRSRSRLGRDDFGANAKRIRTYLARVAEQLPAVE